MKLIPIDPNNLPKCEVLAYNPNGVYCIGTLSLGEFNIILCDSEYECMTNVTHYLPLDQIKPEKIRSFIFTICYANKTGKHSSNDSLDLPSGADLGIAIRNYWELVKKEASVILNCNTSDLVQLSFSCTETT